MDNKTVFGIVMIVAIFISVIVYLSSRSRGSQTPVVENYPQSVPMNVMYSDANGNLGTTTDLGLQNLTVASDSSFGGGLVVNGASKLASSLDVGGDTKIIGKANIVGDTSVGGKISADGISVVANAKSNWGMLWGDQCALIGKKGQPMRFGFSDNTNADGWDEKVRIEPNGNMNTNGNIATSSISTNKPTWNGWITGNFGTGKDRVVIGNLENQATVGAHNNDLNAWTPLRLQGDSINMVPNNGIVNFPKGWRINTSDGHFRIQFNGADKFVVHNEGHPVYAPNGMDVGTWKGTGGGTLNVSGDINGAGGISAGNRNGNVLRYDDPTKFYLPSYGWVLSEYYERARVREDRGSFSTWAARKA